MREYDRVIDITGFFIEGRDLFKRNNEELNFFNLDVKINDGTYQALDKMGYLRIYTVRDHGKLVGYCSFMLQPHLQHKDQMQARQDVLYIQPESRGYGVKFLTWCEEQLRMDGVSFVFRSVTKFKDWSLLLKRLNYEEVETIYMKDLRE